MTVYVRKVVIVYSTYDHWRRVEVMRFYRQFEDPIEFGPNFIG